MENSDGIKIKEKRLDRLITIRISDEDFRVLSNISESKMESVSHIIRTIIKLVTDMVKKNN